MQVRKVVVLLVCWATVFGWAAVAPAGPLEDAAREAGKPLVVRFGLERCLQCIKQGEAFAALGPKYAESMTFRFIHIGQQEALAGAYKILLIPTVLFFDAGGREVFRHVGYLAPEELEAAFAKAGLAAGPAAGG